MSEQNYSKILCEKITELRKKLGLTQEVLAEKLGITFQAISKWENGLSCPDISLLPELAEIFGVSVDELFGRKIVSQPYVNSDLPWNDDDKLRAVVYKGKKILENFDEFPNDFTFTYIGEALNVESYCSIKCDTICGNASAGCSVNCDSIEGNANCNGVINCDAIEGNVSSTGDVKCDTVEGGVSCNGDVKCDTIEGDVTCNGDVNCDTISGNAKTDKGNITCDTIEGDVTCNGAVKCENIKGNVNCNGDMNNN